MFFILIFYFTDILIFYASSYYLGDGKPSSGLESALWILISGGMVEMDALCIHLSKKPTFDLRGVLGGSAIDEERGGTKGTSL